MKKFKCLWVNNDCTPISTRDTDNNAWEVHFKAENVENLINDIRFRIYMSGDYNFEKCALMVIEDE